MKILIYLFLCLIAVKNPASALENNILIYNDGKAQIESEINEYENLKANQPIKGSIFVTHLSSQTINVNDFSMDKKPLPVIFKQSTKMSAFSALEVSIYQFELAGMASGVHELAPIEIKIGNETYQAAPLVLQIPSI